MNIKSILVSFIWIFVFLVISFFIGQVTSMNMGWYDTLVKSPLNPPRIAFPIVWTTLYIMLAVAGYRLWLKRNDDTKGKKHLAFFAAYMVVNWAWSFIFFAGHMIDFGFAWIILSDIILALLIFFLWQNKQKVDIVFLMPTFLWGVFAAYLNGYIVFSG